MSQLDKMRQQIANKTTAASPTPLPTKNFEERLKSAVTEKEPVADVPTTGAPASTERIAPAKTPRAKPKKAQQFSVRSYTLMKDTLDSILEIRKKLMANDLPANESETVRLAVKYFASLPGKEQAEHANALKEYWKKT